MAGDSIFDGGRLEKGDNKSKKIVGFREAKKDFFAQIEPGMPVL